MDPRRKRELTESLFTYCYTLLADAGRADTPGGAEYRRVLAAWLAADRPYPITRFILSRLRVPCLPCGGLGYWKWVVAGRPTELIRCSVCDGFGYPPAPGATDVE